MWEWVWVLSGYAAAGGRLELPIPSSGTTCFQDKPLVQPDARYLAQPNPSSLTLSLTLTFFFQCEKEYEWGGDGCAVEEDAGFEPARRISSTTWLAVRRNNRSANPPLQKFGPTIFSIALHFRKWQLDQQPHIIYFPRCQKTFVQRHPIDLPKASGGKQIQADSRHNIVLN